MVCYSLSNRVGYYVAFLEPLIGFGEREELWVVGRTCQLGDWEKDTVRTSHADFEGDT